MVKSENLCTLGLSEEFWDAFQPLTNHTQHYFQRIKNLNVPLQAEQHTLLSQLLHLQEPDVNTKECNWLVRSMDCKPLKKYGMTTK